MNLIGSCCCVKSRKERGREGGRAFAKYKNWIQPRLHELSEMVALNPIGPASLGRIGTNGKSHSVINFTSGEREGRKGAVYNNLQFFYGEFTRQVVGYGDSKFLICFLVQLLHCGLYNTVNRNLHPQSPVQCAASRPVFAPAWSCPAEQSRAQTILSSGIG
jgi:hypothetical protein